MSSKNDIQLEDLRNAVQFVFKDLICTVILERVEPIFYGKIEGYMNTSLRADRIVDIHKTLRPCLCCAIKFDMAQHGIGQLGGRNNLFLKMGHKSDTSRIFIQCHIIMDFLSLFFSFSVLAENIFQCTCCCQVIKVLEKKFATVQ